MMIDFSFDGERELPIKDVQYDFKEALYVARKCAFILASPAHNDEVGCFYFSKIRNKLCEIEEDLERIEKMQNINKDKE
jgi:hypothetical protein